MGTLILVRHGQASFGSANYDQLSALGHEQGRMLGRWWAARGQKIDRVYTGPMKRHAETCKAAAEGLGAPWPRIHALPGLAEYSATTLFRTGLPQVLTTHPHLQGELLRYQAGGPGASRSFQRVLEALGRAWAKGELEDPELEPWLTFRSRVESSVRTMMAEADKGATVAAFTSGGPIAAAMGMVLDLDELKTLELSWQVHNGALTRFLFSSQRVTLSSFNTTAHLTTEAITYR